jgi:hypothetical protein
MEYEKKIPKVSEERKIRSRSVQSSEKRDNKPREK